MANLVDLDPGADDLTANGTAMAIDSDPAASLKQGATRRKGRGFEGNAADRTGTIATGAFDAIEGSGGGSAAQKSIEGWIVLVTGIHEEASEDDIKERFADFGEIKNLHLNLDRRSGFVKGYVLLEYNTFKEAKAAIDETNETELLGQKISADFAFVTGGRRR
ncbi:RNA-binding protein 8A [Chytriomyces cf. hyalinus JEL632]|nr:RNA-binding protein 8A [Chytriomyces cf. hyalinus JEL632]